MRQDLLTGGTPKRLTHHEGRWILEVERLVALDGTVFRPHTQRLEGSEQIAAYFRRNPRVRQLAQGLQRLLESSTSIVTESFEAVAGEWVPSSLSPDHISKLKRQVQAEAKRDDRIQLIEVKAEVYRLRAECQWLKERLAKLEQGLASGSVRQATGPASPALGNGGEWAEGDSGLVSSSPANDVDERVSEHPGDGADADPDEQSLDEETADVADEEDALEAEQRHLLLPLADDLSRCLRQLVGGDVSSEETDKRINVRERNQVFYVSPLISDEGVEAGAILLDLKAAVYLGGTLMMIPEGALKTQVGTKAPSEDCLEASAEVCNSLTGAINKVADNLHVLAGPLTLLEADKLSWLNDATRRTDLVDSFGGHLVLVAR